MTSLILIVGPKDSGKTTIAWNVLERLWDDATAVRFWDKEDKEITNPDDIWKVKNRIKGDNDFQAIVTVRNQTFAITSGGDYKSTVLNGLQWGWRMRVSGIIQCVSSSNLSALGVIRYFSNTPRKIYRTRSFAIGTPQIGNQVKDIAAKIVKCVLEP